MSREIKFRGKRKDNGEWVEGYYVKTHDGDLDDKTRHLIHRYQTADFMSNFVEVIPETVGQFTGLLDKNGKEIYEGDIIQTKYGHGTYTGVVEWNDVIGAWSWPEGEDWGMIDAGGSKVIGNKYENSELIEETSTVSEV